MIVATVFSVGLISCGDDDDEENVDLPESVTPGLFNGVRITQAGNISYTYSSEGKLQSAHDSYYYYNFSEDMKTVERPKTANTTKDNSATYYLTYNKHGYVATLKFEYPYKSYYGYTATFTYDRNGCLTKIESGNDHKEITLEWKDEYIMGGGVGYGQTAGHGYTNVYTFYNIEGNNKNTTRQYSIEIADMLYEDFYAVLAHLGLLGKGPAYLPDDYTSYVNENNEWEGVDNHTPRAGRIQYTFNSTSGVIEEEEIAAAREGLSRKIHYFRYDKWKY